MKRFAFAALFIPALAFAAEGEPPAGDHGTMGEAILKYIVAPLLPLLGTALVAAVGFFANWLRVKTQQLRFAQAIATAVDLVDSVVRNLEATLRPSVAKALADGRLTAEEAAAIKAEAIKLVMASLPEWAAKLLEGTLGSAVETWMAGQVERAHAQLEQTSMPASPPFPT